MSRVEAHVHPARRIELHLHECRTGMLTDIACARRIRVIVDIVVAPRLAVMRVLRIRLRIAHGNAEPECRVQLEIPGPAEPSLIGSVGGSFGSRSR